MTIRIGIVGAGVIGRSWALLFARAGHDVTLFDAHEATRGTVLARIAADLERIDEPSAAVLARIAISGSLEAAVEGAAYVQESIAEDASLKRAVFAVLDAAASDDTILASSASALLPDIIFGGLAGARRMLVAHPFNPPHLIPVVELVSGSGTACETVRCAAALLTSAGQHTVHVKHAVPGYIGNRLQAAVVAEAMHMVARGIASPDDIDAVLRIGLGRRWSFMGPFETMDLNADGGIEAYFARFAQSYQALASDLKLSEPWAACTMRAVIATRRAEVKLPDLPARAAERDRLLWAITLAERVSVAQSGGSARIRNS